MKTVTGEVVSSKPISLERAAKSMSRFASAENGASNAVSVYLTRTAEAFRELARLHADLKSLRKAKQHDSESTRGSAREKHKKRKHSAAVTELGHSGHPDKELQELEVSKDWNRDVSNVDERHIKKRRKHRAMEGCGRNVIKKKRRVIIFKEEYIVVLLGEAPTNICIEFGYSMSHW